MRCIALAYLVCVAALAACSDDSAPRLIASGKELLERNDPKGAVIQFKNALDKKPDSASARALLGRALLESGDAPAAIIELRKAQELGAPDDEVLPTLARAMMQAGEEGKVVAQFAQRDLADKAAAADLRTTVASAHLLKGDTEAARGAAKAALELKPGHPPAVVLLARLLAARGDHDAALAMLGEVLAAEPGNEAAGVLRAQLLWLGKADPAAAEVGLRKVLAVRPGALSAMSTLVTMLLQQERLEDAKVALAALRKVAPDSLQTLYLEGQVALAGGDPAKAREFADRILKSFPNDARTLELAGIAEFRQRRDVQAEALLARALKASPGLLLSRHLLARLYLRNGQPAQAVEVLRLVAESEQADATTLALAGEAYLQTGDFRRADAAFQRATQAAPSDPGVRAAAALSQFAQGHTAPALRELEAAAAGDPGTRVDLALLGAQLDAGNLAAALKTLDGIERKRPGDPVAPHLRGRVLLLEGDVAGATRSFETALARNARYFPAVASLASIEVSQGRPEAARKRLEAVVAQDPRNHAAMLLLAELMARTGSPPAQVLGKVKEAIQLNPEVASLRLLLIEQYLRAGDARQALEAAQAAAAALPNDLAVLEMLGRAQIATGDGQQAVSTFKRLTALRPDNPIYQVRLADAHVVAKDLASAERALREALEIQPELVIAKRAQVGLALVQGRPAEGLVVARQLQKDRPKDPTGFELEGDVEVVRGNAATAVAAYRAAVQRGGDSGVAAKLGSALLRAGQAAEFDRFAAEWMRQRPRDAVFLYFLGDVTLGRKQFAEAEQRYRRVLELEPQNALAMNNVAWLMVHQGRPGATALAEQANALMPDRPMLLDTLAAALAAEGQPKKALEVQVRAVALAPQDPALKLQLARLLIRNDQKDRARAELDGLAKLGDRFADQAEVARLLKTL